MSEYHTNGEDIGGFIGESLIKTLSEKDEVVRKKSSVNHIKKNQAAIEKRLGCKIEIIKTEKAKTFLIKKESE